MQRERHWPAVVRAKAVDVALARSEWLSTGRWEALGPHASWPDFPVVCDALNSFLSEQEGIIKEALSIAHAQERGVRRQILQMPTVYRQSVCPDSHISCCWLHAFCDVPVSKTDCN